MKKTTIITARTTMENITLSVPSINDWVCGKYELTAKSESGVTRTLSAHGKNTVTVESDLSALYNKYKATAEDKTKLAEELEKKLESILMNGFTLEGVHYTFFMFSPSNARNAEIVFVKGKDWAEVQSLLSEITGLHYGADNTDSLSPVSAFGKASKGGKVLFSKIFARESARAAGSVPIAELSPKAAAILHECKVLFVVDVEDINNMPWHNPMDGKSGKTRVTTITDGMVFMGRKGRACIGHAEGKITDEELDLIRDNPLSPKADKILRRCPAFAQARMKARSMKGACHWADLDKYTDGEYDFIVFDSARKYEDGDWDFAGLELCNVSHRGTGFTSISAPIITAMIRGDVDLLDPIAKFWMDKVDAVFSEDLITSSKAVRYVMNAMSTRETEDEADNRTVITKALESNLLLDRDHYVWSKVTDKMRAFATRMAAGKLAVPGAYPYITVDPNYTIKKLIEMGVLVGSGVEIPTLKSGEYYFNGKTCRAIMARSPLTHPNQVKRIQLCGRTEFNSYRDVLVLNAVDGIWIDLAGADMDGDEVLLALEEGNGDFPKEAMTKLIDTVSNEKVLNFEEGLEGEYVEYSYENRIKFLIKNAKRSQVGVLNNAYSAWAELYTHLRNLFMVTKNNGCKFIRFEDEYKYCGTVPYTIVDNVVVTKAIKGIVNAGHYDSTLLLTILKDIWQKIARLEILQSREVDAAKTGKGATPDDVASVSISAIPWSMIARQYSKNKFGDTASRNKKVVEAAKAKAVALANGMDDRIFGYRAFTPLGHLTEIVSEWWNNLQGKIAVRGVNHYGYLYGLLTDQERSWFHYAYDTVAGIKNAYSKDIAAIMKSELSDENAKRMMRKEVTERALASLNAVVSNGCPIEVVAVAAYEVCYLKNGSFNTGLAFGWLLPDALLKVFERGDMKYAYTMLGVEGTTGFVQNGDVFVGTDKGKFNLDMGGTMFKDQTFTPYYSMSGKLAAFIQKQVEYAVDARKGVAPAVQGDVLGLTVLNCNSEEFKAKVKANGFVFVITLDDVGKTVAKINDKTVADVVMVNTRQLQLMNKAVRWVRCDDAPFKQYETAIKNICVVEA